MVSPCEGNEVTREACQEVRTPDTTVEVGELEPGFCAGGTKESAEGSGCRIIGSLLRTTSDAWKFESVIALVAFVIALVARSINGTAANSELGTEIAGPAVADKTQCFHIARSLYDP